MTLNICWDGGSAYLPDDYSAGTFTTTVSPRGQESNLSQRMVASVTQAGI